MPTDAAKRSAEIDQMKGAARAEYPHLWHRLIEEWKGAELEDAAWLTYAANYLFSTGGVKWAMDPLSLFTRIEGGEQPDFAHDLDRLQLVVLTHAHRDHLDLSLISAIQSLSIAWVIPEFMLENIKQAVDISGRRILVPRVGCPIQFGRLILHPFNGLHFNQGNGVPEMGYLAEFNGKRWLFPGDTRNYDATLIPHNSNLTGVFAHLWLGKACALEDLPALLSDFCQFHLALKTEQIIVTHLQEMGRAAEDYWDLNHYWQAQRVWKEVAPSISVKYALMGQKVIL